MGWYPDDISGGRLKKIVYFVYGKIKKNVYLPSFSYSVAVSNLLFRRPQTLSSFSITKIRASPHGWATCSVPIPA